MNDLFFFQENMSSRCPIMFRMSDNAQTIDSLKDGDECLVLNPNEKKYPSRQRLCTNMNFSKTHQNRNFCVGNIHISGMKPLLEFANASVFSELIAQAWHKFI